MTKTRLAAAMLLAGALAACAGSGDDGANDQGFARDGDSGAAAPATRQELSPYHTPDSTTGEVNLQAGGGRTPGGAGTNTPARPGGKAAADTANRPRKP